MSKRLGRLAKVTVSVDDTTYTPVKGMKETTFSGSRAEIKVTSHDDGDFETYLPGRVDGSIDLKLFLDDADAGQGILNAAWLAGSIIYAHFVQVPGATSGKSYKGKVIVTKFEQVGGDNDAAAINLTLRFAGPLVYTAQDTTDQVLATV